LLLNKKQPLIKTDPMKKLILFFFLGFIAALIVNAQSLQLSDSTGLLQNNTTIFKYGSPSADEILSYIFVKNTKNDSISVNVKKVHLVINTGTMNLLCWGLCFDTSVYVTHDPIVIHAGRTDSTDFSAHYLPNGAPAGISTIRYVFFDANNPSDSVCVNISFDTYPQGIKGFSGKNLFAAFPNPADDYVNFSFSLPAGSEGMVVIRDLLGSSVKEVPVTSVSGKISVNTLDLADGIYFYTFLSNGNQISTRKLVIRH
jgi:hypothetical protein